MLGIYDQLLSATVNLPPEEILEVAKGEQRPFEAGSASQYKELTVVSGKGGTGKTTVAGSLARLAKDKVLADNDVDAADLHLLLRPVVREAHDFYGGYKAEIDPERCTGCGKCAEACHFGAIRLDGARDDYEGRKYRVEEFACEGCGLCPLVCPVDAIRSERNMTGRWYVSGTVSGPMVHARLGIAEENSGRLVTRVRKRAAELADELKQELILGDGPPGTGCPVIASVSGVDLVVIVTEPTVSGVHDMERVLKLAKHFGSRAVVIVNKADLNKEQAERIEAICRRDGGKVLGEIPFDPKVNEALVAGKTVIDYGGGKAEKAIYGIWDNLQKELEGLYR